MKAKWWQGSLLYLLILVTLLALAFSLFPVNKGPKEVDFYTFLDNAKSNQISVIQQDGNNIIGVKDDRPAFKAAFVGSTKELLDSLKAEGVKLGEGGIKFEVVTGGFDWGSIMLSFLPLVLFGALLFFLFRSARGANTQAFNFGKSRARMTSGDKPAVSFADVAGVDESKGELQEVVEFLKSPQKFQALGARIPRGLLLIGPPGCGKTLIAKATAGEAGVPFFSISGSEFVEMFVGVGASRVRDLFDNAKRNAPCIVFVDEIDAVGRHRGAGLGGGHDEREQTLNQILVEMDGFDSNTNVIVLAATNRPDILDPALLRPGRFDRHIVIDQPDINGRKAILMVHAKGKPIVDKETALNIIARETPGFSGADLANLINEAAILAARRNRKDITIKEMEDAIDRVIAGPEKKGRVITKSERELIAYHEVGHALAAKKLPNADPVHKISIVARGMMGGWTRFLPNEERHLETYNRFKDSMVVALAGRAAEQVAFNELSTGAQNDLEKVTTIARRMITEFGMSRNLGPRTFGKREEMVFLGKEIHEQQNYSDKFAEAIDEEIEQLVKEAYDKAIEIMMENKDRLKYVAEYLMEKETIDDVTFEKLLTDPLPVASFEATAAS